MNPQALEKKRQKMMVDNDDPPSDVNTQDGNGVRRTDRIDMLKAALIAAIGLGFLVASIAFWRSEPLLAAGFTLLAVQAGLFVWWVMDVKPRSGRSGRLTVWATRILPAAIVVLVVASIFI